VLCQHWIGPGSRKPGVESVVIPNNKKGCTGTCQRVTHYLDIPEAAQ